VLRKSRSKGKGWIKRVFADKLSGFVVRIHPRDESGAKALSELSDRGIHLVANALAQSADHIVSSFNVLHAEKQLDGGRTFRLIEGEPLPPVTAKTCIDRILSFGHTTNCGALPRRNPVFTSSLARCQIDRLTQGVKKNRAPVFGRRGGSPKPLGDIPPECHQC
jgi:hypothetical protein